MTRQRRNAAVVGSLAVVGLLGAGLAIVSLKGTPEAHISTAANPALPVTVPGVPAAPAPGKGAPETIVVLRATGEVALIEAASGDTIRVLASHAADSLRTPALAADRTTVYYAVVPPAPAETPGHTGCTGTIFRVALDGRSPAEPVVDGAAPSVSPDGRTLAYAKPTAAGGCPTSVVARQLATGAERSWRYPADEVHATPLYVDGSITELAWAPDSRRLAYTLSYEGESVAVLDTVTHSDLAQTTEVVIPAGGGDSRHPAWQASTGRLAVVNMAFECCFDDDYHGPVRTLAVELPSRKVTNLLPAGQRPLWLDFDVTGHHLLSVEDGRLSRKSDGGRARRIATGITAADW